MQWRFVLRPILIGVSVLMLTECGAATTPISTPLPTATQTPVATPVREMVLTLGSWRPEDVGRIARGCPKDQNHRNHSVCQCDRRCLDRCQVDVHESGPQLHRFDEVRLDFTGLPRDWLAALRLAALQADGDRVAIQIDEVCVDRPALAAALRVKS